MSTSKSLDIGGVYPPISTPFNASEDIDWDQLANNMQKYNKIGFKGTCSNNSFTSFRVDVCNNISELVNGLITI